MINPYLIPRKAVQRVWESVEPIIAVACAYNGNRYKSEDYLKDLTEGTKQLWLAKDAVIKGVVVTEIAPFPQKKCCIIDIVTGEDFASWKHLVSIVEQWAKEIGCQQMFMPARLGMSRAMKEFGYNAKHIILEKDL